MKKFGLALALVVAAGAAQAKDPTFGGSLNGLTGNVGTGSTRSSVLSFDVGGINSWDGFGSALNEVYSSNIGANSHVIGIGWDVNLTANSPSWLSELVVSFESTSTTYVFLTAGVGNDFPGSANFSSGGIVDLVGIGLDFSVDGDGALVMEFFEGFDDFGGGIDGHWDSGTIWVEYEPVPAPGAFGLLAGAGLLAARRRR
ncbi:MAG: PEP-CTERM sorting domain-containing protein [Phycisphaerae bacterium]|nr:PEP-CTERM sorting domain-containing protein [Phycisphaerae bacterium]